MKSNVFDLRPPAAPAAAVEFEPIEAAVREISARVTRNGAERRRLFSRVHELRGLTPSLRRRRPRGVAPEPSRPVTFYSIEEAEPVAPAPLQVA